MSNNPHRDGTAQQACAACRYQRRKCGPDCILAPYFPHDRSHQFLNAHRLFGVKKITKLISNIPPHVKDHAMQSIIYQSDARAVDPVGGCARIILRLKREIELYTAELNFVMHQLAICRVQLAHQKFNQLGGYEMPHFGERHEDVRGEEYLKLFKEVVSDDHEQDLGEDKADHAWVMQDSMSDMNTKPGSHNELFGDDDEMKTILQVPNDEKFELNSILEVPNDKRFEFK